MKANELRIGNLIHSIDEDFNNELIVVDANDICNVDCEDDNDGYEPIPLTAEWLEKFGFRTSGPKLLFLPIPKHRMEIHYEMQPYGNVVTLQSDFGMLIPNDIQYIHQLQNLFFAVTGEELTIREDAK